MAQTRVGFLWWFCTFAGVFMQLDVIPSTVTSEVWTTSTETSSASEVPCGEGLCLCTESSANCSGRLAHVAYIPELPDKITALDLSQNNFTSAILSPHVFENLTSIVDLDLSFNKFTWIPREVFDVFENLHDLTVNNNEELQVESLREILSIYGLSYVSAKGCNLPPPPRDLLENITVWVSRLELNSNPHGGSYPLDGFCGQQHTSYLVLTLTDCDFNDVTTSQEVFLWDVDLSGNTLRRFPKTCMNGESLFPVLNALRLAHNRIHALTASEICLPWLTYLDISYNNIQLYPAGVFSSNNFPILQMLFLAHQAGYSEVRTRVEDDAFQNHNLHTLDLSHNHLEFADRDTIGKYAFYNCFGLTNLNLAANDLSNVNVQRFRELFDYVDSLLTLSLTNTKFHSDLVNVFVHFRRLSVLLLNNNLISSVPDGAFDASPLGHLRLDNNRIQTISEHTFGPELRQSLRVLSLSFNPWECSCELRWFQQWLTSQPGLFAGFKVKLTDYKCNNLPGTPLLSFYMDEQACVLSREASLLLIHLSIVVIVTLTAVSLVFRYRWHLRLLMYEVFRGRNDLRRNRLRDNDFQYDVFVSYAAEDLPWVRQQLLIKLEAEMGLRLCVHERDFIPGQHIVDNITHSVQSSKKILMVFSAHFLHSEWCQFELALCLTHVMDFDDAMIVVCVDDVITRELTSAMRAVLKTTTYIQWRDGREEDVVFFWRRVQLALREIMPPVCTHV